MTTNQLTHHARTGATNQSVGAQQTPDPNRQASSRRRDRRRLRRPRSRPRPPQRSRRRDARSTPTTSTRSSPSSIRSRRQGWPSMTSHTRPVASSTINTTSTFSWHASTGHRPRPPRGAHGGWRTRSTTTRWSIAAGAVSHDFGIPGVAEQRDGPENRSTTRSRFAITFSNGSRLRPPSRPRSTTVTSDVVICGGGPTGVELAGAFSELFGRVLAKDFPHLDVERCRIVVVEGSDRLLGKFSAAKQRTSADLACAGAASRSMTGVKVDKIEPAEVHLSNGSPLRAHTIVWAAGVRGHPLAERTGCPTRSRRPNHR